MQCQVQIRPMLQRNPMVVMAGKHQLLELLLTAAAVQSFIQAAMVVLVAEEELLEMEAMDLMAAEAAEEVGVRLLSEMLVVMEALMAAGEVAVGKPQAVMEAFMVEMAVVQIISIVAKMVLVK